ncbi:MAG TPA: hypothetical protein VFQ37_00815 [Mycobacterium sp.]|nr:hypothetical protein [Mycobacterium sp.]
MTVWTKDPDDEDWFEFDWSDQGETPWLPTGVTISSYTVTVDDALTKVSDSQSGASVFVKVSGGTAGTDSVVSCEISASDGNTYKTSKPIQIFNRSS